LSLHRLLWSVSRGLDLAFAVVLWTEEPGDGLGDHEPRWGGGVGIEGGDVGGLGGVGRRCRVIFIYQDEPVPLNGLWRLLLVFCPQISDPLFVSGDRRFPGGLKGWGLLLVWKRRCLIVDLGGGLTGRRLVVGGWGRRRGRCVGGIWSQMIAELDLAR